MRISNFDLAVCYTNVGRGLAPAVSLIIKGFHGGSNPPPYIVDRSLNCNFSFFQILIYRTVASSLLQRRRLFYKHQFVTMNSTVCPAGQTFFVRLVKQT